MNEIPIEQLAAAGVVGVLCITFLIAWRMYLNAKKPADQQTDFNPLGLILLPLLAASCLLTACGQYSQARMDHHQKTKEDQVYLVERAQQQKLTATELRSKLQTQDVAMLAEQAHKGEGLEALRKRLEAESDQATAKLFNGDTGRTDPPGE